MRIVAPLTRPILLTGSIIVAINVWGDYLWPTIVIQDPQRLTISAGMIQFVGGLGMNVSEGGAVFAAYAIVIAPMVLLVVLSMRYFVSGITEGAVKL
jgi:multiple sugar transport system permease protein